MENEEIKDNIFTNDEEGDVMPTIKSVECEKIAYIKGMEEYLQKLKTMPNSEAVKRSKFNLENSHIIQKNGEFTERYRYSRLHSQSKG
ncbi:MAG: hypothetical protein HDR14_15195 [Lachnospiraceae bacterium]|nr:hypothetical protein [Lachnospiraceae bacterium]